MAFSTTFERVKEKFNNKYWDSIEDFEEGSIPKQDSTSVGIISVFGQPRDAVKHYTEILKNKK